MFVRSFDPLSIEDPYGKSRLIFQAEFLFLVAELDFDAQLFSDMFCTSGLPILDQLAVLSDGRMLDLYDTQLHTVYSTHQNLVVALVVHLQSTERFLVCSALL